MRDDGGSPVLYSLFNDRIARTWKDAQPSDGDVNQDGRAGTKNDIPGTPDPKLAESTMAAFDSNKSVQKRDRGAASPIQQRRATGGGVQLKSNGYVQQRAEVSPEGGDKGYEVQRKEVAPVQMHGEGGATDAGVQEAAAHGVADSGQQLPHLDAIQTSFGGHDVSGVSAHVGGAAREAGESMGAEAYATGNDVAFNSAPDLHTAAHEAAHVVQQRAGVQLLGGVGEVGDKYEQNADAVADRVVAGQSAEDLLPGGSAGQGGAGVQHKKAPVQKLGKRLDEEAGDGLAKENESLPYSHQDRRSGEWTDTEIAGSTTEYDYKTGDYKKTQRKYTFGQYQKMWEEEKGRPMTGAEIATLERGCIGITVLNLFGGGNPPLGEAFATFEQGKARMQHVKELIKEHPNMTAADAKEAGLRLNFSGTLGQYNSVLFAKLFWSNQGKAPNQEDFNKGSQEWDEEHIWKKEPLMLPNGKTVDQMLTEDGRAATVSYIENELGWAEYEKLNKEQHDKNVAAYYLAWAKAINTGKPEAFPIDGETGHVDMTGYQYQGRTKVEKNDKGEDEYAGGYVNFDYGFYDETTDSIWHANHMQYKQGDEKREKQPMYVYQSTVEKFTKGYTDFDRVIFCVGLQKAYDPNAAANNH